MQIFTSNCNTGQSMPQTVADRASFGFLVHQNNHVIDPVTNDKRPAYRTRIGIKKEI
jgi:hypothetical protein